MTDIVEVDSQVLGYLRVSHPWFEVTKPIHQLTLDLSIGSCLVVISVGAIGWLLSGLVIQPVRESYQHLKQFTADASHELRNQIAMIQTNVQVALADLEFHSSDSLSYGVATHQQQLQVIERLTHRLGRLVDDLLFLARQDSGIVQSKFAQVPLDALLMELVEEQKAIATAKGISLDLKITPPNLIENQSASTQTPQLNDELHKNQDQFPIIKTPVFEEDMTLTADWEQLARLFTNLIHNAIQYTPSGGEVVVELQHLAKTKKQIFGTKKGELSNSFQNAGVVFRGCQNLKSESLLVIVKDNGIGIPSQAFPHLFDRFYRVAPAHSHYNATGSGLGLAIALAIVENHHGQIILESHPQIGTMATVILPLDQTQS